jgi:foldase protein PrsA
MKLLGPRVKVTDEEVKAGYEANKAYMHQAEMVQARLIVVGSEAEAKDLKKRLEQGEKFEDLAMKYSLDPESKQNGGAMGLVPKGSGLLSEQQERVLFALAQGQVSVPVEAKGQWVLFRVDAKVPAKDPTYEEVKDYLRQRMIERKFREELPKWMLELRKAAQVERKITF